ncbi:hypothetical protein DMENIID0001_018320 [Sergentomyia squamirostris]
MGRTSAQSDVCWCYSTWPHSDSSHPLSLLWTERPKVEVGGYGGNGATFTTLSLLTSLPSELGTDSDVLSHSEIERSTSLLAPNTSSCGPYSTGDSGNSGVQDLFQSKSCAEKILTS